MINSFRRPSARATVKFAVIVAVVASAGAIAVAAAPSWPGGASSDVPEVVKDGTPVALSARERGILARLERPAAAVGLLRTSGGRSYYRIGQDCYGVGPSDPSDYRFGAVKCAAVFPSAERPILDFTILHGNFEAGDVSVWRSEGIAADNVASVGLRTSSGEVVGQTSVHGNTYRITPIPDGELTEIVAFDAAGNVLYAEPVVPPRSP